MYLEPNWPLFLKVNPPKQGPFQSKQGSFGFSVYLMSTKEENSNQKERTHTRFSLGKDDFLNESTQKEWKVRMKYKY